MHSKKLQKDSWFHSNRQNPRRLMTILLQACSNWGARLTSAPAPLVLDYATSGSKLGIRCLSQIIVPPLLGGKLAAIFLIHSS